MAAGPYTRGDIDARMCRSVSTVPRVLLTRHVTSTSSIRRARVRCIRGVKQVTVSIHADEFSRADTKREVCERLTTIN